MARELRHTFRYLIPGEHRTGERLTLPSADAHHLTRVVRRKAGETIEVGDGAGRLWRAIIVDRERATIELTQPIAADPPAPVRLVVGLLDSQRLDMVVEKAAELAVHECIIVLTERVQRRPAASEWSRRAERLDRIAHAAARQSGSATIMAVRGLVPFAQIVAETDASTATLIDPRGTDPVHARLHAAARGRKPSELVTVAVGPEAGFAPGEVTAAHAAGWGVCPLGSQVLRAETAAMSATTLALAALGRFGEGR